MTDSSVTNFDSFDSFDALVFDCDGTLADTMPAHFLAWSQTVARLGLSFPEDRFYSLGGVPAHRIMAMLAAEQGVKLDPVVAAAEKEAAFERLLDAILPIEPVVAVARRYRGIKPMAVATGGYRHIVERTLTNLNIRPWFDHIVAMEDVEHHKPAPDTYLVAAQRLGVDPRRCCAFEDTDLGLESARSAGMTTVDIRQLCASLRCA